jgi:hypothetical protein
MAPKTILANLNLLISTIEDLLETFGYANIEVADSNIKDRSITLLMACVLEPSLNEEVLDIVLKYTDVNETNAKGWTALGWAVAKRDVAWVEALLMRGADPNIMEIPAKSILDYAIRNGSDDKINILLDYGASISQKDFRAMVTSKEISIGTKTRAYQIYKQALKCVNEDNTPELDLYCLSCRNTRSMIHEVLENVAREQEDHLPVRSRELGYDSNDQSDQASDSDQASEDSDHASDSEFQIVANDICGCDICVEAESHEDCEESCEVCHIALQHDIYVNDDTASNPARPAAPATPAVSATPEAPAAPEAMELSDVEKEILSIYKIITEAQNSMESNAERLEQLLATINK